MNQKHKDFILEKLIPFIMREQGRGFDMDLWLLKKDHVDHNYWNIVIQDQGGAPACNTICCIGGSIEFLLNQNPMAAESGLATLGLSHQQRDALFYGWSGCNEGDEWPTKFQTRFFDAETPKERAKVACDLLREIVKTEGACLSLKEEAGVDRD